MPVKWITAILAFAAAGLAGAGRPISSHAPSQRIRVVLVGDSTVTADKGWGAGFCALMGPGVECLSAAAGGRSSRSYIEEGRWKEALALKADYYLVQFGHNDEPGKGADRETDPRTSYRAYLSQYADDARRAGAAPVLITPLTRRRFDDSGRLAPSLVPYAEAVRAVASDERIALVDLHARSVEITERMGAAAWEALSPRDEAGGVDRTHLAAAGGQLIGRLVARELRRAVPALARHLVAPEGWADAVVARDGSGDFAGVQEAIDGAPQNTSAANRWMIFVKPGAYREVVYVQREKRHVSLIGADPATTTITFDLHAKLSGLDGRATGTFRTPTVTIDADDFSAENLTIENAAGPVGQALALRVDGDRVVFRNCRLLGWQDTVFLNRGRHYFEDVLVAGHVDFIFGAATAWFERAHLHAWQKGYITAASTPPGERHGFVFARGRITGEPGVRTYLGRPWRDHAQTAFIATDMSDAVEPQGWHNWDRPERERTARYEEYGSTGPGGRAEARVTWAKTLPRAAALSPARVLGGSDRWDPAKVPAHVSGAKVSALPIPDPPGPRAAGSPTSGVILLWPEGVPGAKIGGGDERIEDERVYNVQHPSLTLYQPAAGRSTGAAVIVCPGGAYRRLAIEKEGTSIARMLADRGVTAFVLRYRMAEYGHPAPLQDVLRAIRLVRSRAAEFGVRADRIGVWGASAGGHLAASAATLFDAAEGRTGAPLDAVSGRPDFAALLYPVITMQPPYASEASRRNLLGESPSPGLLERLSLERQVGPDTPPVFLAHTGEDTSVPVENSLMFYAALRKAGVPAELHVFERGAHGFALAPDLGPASAWPARLEQWLRAHGWL